MKTKILFCALASMGILCSCGGGKSKLAEIAEAYTQIGVNNEKYAEGYRALYEMPKDKQEAELNALNSKNEKWQAENESLAKKTEKLASDLLGTDFPCSATENSGITVKSARFTTASSDGKVANFVITVDFEGQLNGKPYFSLMAGDQSVYRSLGSLKDNGQLSVNFRINLKNARTFAAVEAMRIEVEVNGSIGQEVQQQTETEPVYQGDGDGNAIQNAGNGIVVGANLANILRNASNVTYEYNADSGIWATIGNVAIIIDEDQLNQSGIDFISGIESDIAPDIAFKPEYVKADARINQIEKL